MRRHRRSSFPKNLMIKQIRGKIKSWKSPLFMLPFVWVLKPRFKKLHFAALTVGAIIPDIEPLIA
jgi:hypothetical protein